MPRGSTLAGRLAALGFADTDAAQRLLTDELGLAAAGADGELVAAIAAAPDPDLALAGLARLPRDEELIDGLRADPGLRSRLLAVLGASPALADHLRRHPADWRLLSGPEAECTQSADELTAELLAAADPERASIGPAEAAEALRLAYRRALLRLAARDLTGTTPLDEVMAELADIASAALRAALGIATTQLPEDAAGCRLAVIAMGKCGARELNYASDVDVIFVAEPAGDASEAIALRMASRLASAMIRICADAGREGSMFPVDPNLRPEGRSGPLVRTLASHQAYYQRWAKTWEFQALLKARPVAGDAELGRHYVDSLLPLVWQAASREGFVADVRAMRRRVIESLPAADADRELKLGPGGLRDIEFAVQLLQLVHGRADTALHEAATLPALQSLAAGGYVGRQDAGRLADAYRFLRTVEHLIQMRSMRRTHTLPGDPATLRQVGRAMRAMRRSSGAAGPPAAAGNVADPAADLLARWQRHSAVVRQLHEKLFYRPLLDAVATLPGEVITLTSQAAADRLAALGYADPGGALRHIEVLAGGISRKAAIQRALLPAMLGWFADAPRPDAGLLAFRQVSEALGESPWYLRLLRDDTKVAWRMTRLLASGSFATGLLLRAPEAVAMLADDALLAPREPATLQAEADALVGRHMAAGDADAAAAGLLALRRRELLRTAGADLLGMADIEQVTGALSAMTRVVVAATLDLATLRFEHANGRELPARMCVVAMGRFGGHEMGYASDADVLFVYEPSTGSSEEEATRAAQQVAEDLRALLGRPGPDPPLGVDADLRPEGRQGPLVRTLAAYRAYYDRWAHPWEAQALLRADPVAGDPELRAAFANMADGIRYAHGGIGDGSILEIRRIKARMEAERMPRGVDPALHVKLGPGGLTDTEWVAQLLQLRHASAVPELRTTRTVAALAGAAAAGLISQSDAAALTESWLLATRIRNAVLLVRGRGSDVLPTAQPDLAATAKLLGYSSDGGQDLVQDWRRTARRGRAVMERVFYG
jgi:glutamate-ammonia-ligase adenylyltransferase